MKKERVAVRHLVEFILRKGSIDSRHTSEHTAQEGARIHRMLQKEAGDNYQKEVHLALEIPLNERTYIVEGRADGIIEEDEQVVIDEIKTSEPAFEDLRPEAVDMYWYQAMCYGHIYCVQEKLTKISIQLTYYQTTEKIITRTRKEFAAEELAIFFEDLVARFEEWMIFRENWRKIRNSSLKELTFPYGEYRKGQRELAVAAYKTILTERQLFVEAPTGTGKTISTLFPSLKAIGEEKAKRIFYLTAKTITRQVAEDAVNAMSTKGMQAKSLTITAKDKICFLTERNCTPEACPFANGYYDRLNEGLWDLLNHETQITREVVERYARKHTLCPFELSLDVSLWCDVIICDYNYLFDPIVYLRRFFEEENKENIFLVDEAHNLVDRSREMFSASLSKNKVLDLKKKMTDDKKLTRTLTKWNKEMVALRKVCEEREVTFVHQQAPVDSLIKVVYQFTEAAKEWLAENREAPEQEAVLPVYFEALNYLKISEFYDDHYVTYINVKDYDVVIKQYCLDPSYLLNQTLEKGKAAILFSASLTPLDYYQEILGGNEESLAYRIPSPFEEERQLLVIDRTIQTTYRKRAESLPTVVDRLAALPQQKMGNYLFFFPSYRYMDDVYQEFTQRYPNIRTIIQDTEMDEIERERFLAKFHNEPTESLIGFCVLGGIFSEGIDLKGDRLIGVGIVGVGLPQLNDEQDLIKEYYDVRDRVGFNYAYLIPGMNKVLQAAGRVIRDVTDQGVVLLLDQRFLTDRYQRLFPNHWHSQRVIRNSSELENTLQIFWRETLDSH